MTIYSHINNVYTTIERTLDIWTDTWKVLGLSLVRENPTGLFKANTLSKNLNMDENNYTSQMLWNPD
jgi:hypothetical protein